VDVYLHEILISALDGSEWSVSRSDRFTAGTNWTGYVHLLNQISVRVTE